MTDTRLLLLAGGAAKALVRTLEDRFHEETGIRVDGTFTAVGTVRDNFVGGAPADVLVLSKAVVEELSDLGLVAPGSAKSVGEVRTGVAVPAREAAPEIGDAEAFRALLLGSRAVYIPDPDRSTAGIHFMKVLDRLRIRDDVVPKLKAFPNGETAMARLAEDAEPGAIGCTQMTEIRMTPGLKSVGAFPGDLDLSTLYVAAVSATAQNAGAAAHMVDMLASGGLSGIRRTCGFVS